MAKYVETNILRDAAAGRWDEILGALGFTMPTPSRGKHSPCPFCGRKHSGGGSDAFRWSSSSKRGGKFTAWCGSTAMYDGFDCLLHAGWRFIDAKDAVAGYLQIGNDLTDEYKARLDRQAAAHREKIRQEVLKENQMRLDDRLRFVMECMTDSIRTTGTSNDRKSNHSQGTRDDMAIILLETLMKTYPQAVENLAQKRLDNAAMMALELNTIDKIYSQGKHDENSKQYPKGTPSRTAGNDHQTNKRQRRPQVDDKHWNGAFAAISV